MLKGHAKRVQTLDEKEEKGGRDVGNGDFGSFFLVKRVSGEIVETGGSS